MPVKPSKETLNADRAFKRNPDFPRAMLETIINETPELMSAVSELGIVDDNGVVKLEG